ncbi:hypothetical protein KTR66_08790 [Roseococcus sp. SDR]|uniref:hypothetical protein n=1 Tax=Roseococcus sp. SDR TaxID=2835532 RepID=UPI001BCCE786|nr:hypothetical protein [Roseococcus sp. SDR]MBS7790089.1 hypothetical protein [Roseococcus sp. SDR]MBV1845403.1 hypothetical protein [Roseococcus sp. SDR]
MLGKQQKAAATPAADSRRRARKDEPSTTAALPTSRDAFLAVEPVPDEVRRYLDTLPLPQRVTVYAALGMSDVPLPVRGGTPADVILELLSTRYPAEVDGKTPRRRKASVPTEAQLRQKSLSSAELHILLECALRLRGVTTPERIGEYLVHLAGRVILLQGFSWLSGERPLPHEMSISPTDFRRAVMMALREIPHGWPDSLAERLRRGLRKLDDGILSDDFTWRRGARSDLRLSEEQFIVGSVEMWVTMGERRKRIEGMVLDACGIDTPTLRLWQKTGDLTPAKRRENDERGAIARQEWAVEYRRSADTRLKHIERELHEAADRLRSLGLRQLKTES